MNCKLVLSYAAIAACAITFSSPQTAYADVVTHMLGDADFFGFNSGTPGVNNIPFFDTFNNEPSDPVFTDRDIRRSNPGPNNASWTHDLSSLLGPTDIITSGSIRFPVAGMQSGVEGLTNRLFIEGIELVGALDSVNLGPRGTAVLNFDLTAAQITAFSTDYQLNVLVDGGVTIFGERDSYYIDFSQAMINTVIPEPTLVGDLNANGFVGIADLNIVLSHWNQNVTSGDLLLGDPSGDGFVGMEDINIVLGNWNAGTPPPSSSVSVPEPASTGTLLLGSLALLRRAG